MLKIPWLPFSKKKDSSSASPRGQWRIGKNGENWLQNHLWCPKDLCGEQIDDDDDEERT